MSLQDALLVWQLLFCVTSIIFTFVRLCETDEAKRERWAQAASAVRMNRISEVIVLVVMLIWLAYVLAAGER